MGGSFLSQQGLYKTDAVMKDYDTNANYNKWNYRVNVDIDVTKTTLLKLGVAGALDTQKDPGTGTWNIWNALMGYNPILVPVMYSNGYVPTYKDEGGGGFNPWVQATQTGYRESWNNNMECTLELQQKLDFLTKGLSFKFRFVMTPTIPTGRTSSSGPINIELHRTTVTRMVNCCLLV